MRRMVEKGLLSDDDVGAIYKEAASKLRGFDQSEARVALSALENKIIPDTKRRAIDTTATKPATISSVTKPSSQKSRRDSIAAYVFYLFIILAILSICGAIAAGFSSTARGADGAIVTVLPFFGWLPGRFREQPLDHLFNLAVQSAMREAIRRVLLDFNSGHKTEFCDLARRTGYFVWAGAARNPMQSTP